MAKVGLHFLKTFLYKTLVQEWGANLWPKSIWDFKSEISLLYFNNFTLIKLISLYDHYVNIMFHC